MVRRPLAAVIWLVVMAACAPLPEAVPSSALGSGDAARGRSVFWAGGCGSCHATPGSDARLPPRLGGGRALVTRHGTFHAPNISPDPVHGIGAWSAADFARAMLHGVSPAGEHYYPAFPYPSYARMRGADIADLRAYLASLPPVARPDVPHDLRAPWRNRRLLGPWKRRYLRAGPATAVTGGAAVARGQYLVEGPGHCGACHTPRDALGGPGLSRWLAGSGPDVPHPAPNITPASAAIAEAGIDEIAALLAPAETHDATGDWGDGMEAVRRNLAHLPVADRRAIAAYLKAIAPRE